MISESPRRLVLLGAFIALSLPAQAMEMEPRRWGHLPIGLNYLSAGYIQTDANIFLDPALRIDNAKMELETWAAKYIHSFAVLGKSARVDLTQAYQEGRWKGTVDGAYRSIQRNGLADSQVRLAVNFLGAPPLKGKDFAAWRAGTKRETICGAGVVVQLPTGDYMKDKLINLGSNRFTIRPQMGITHSHNKWTEEFTGEVWFYTKNTAFFNGNTLAQAPLYTGQAHLIYTFLPGLWLGGSFGYSSGGESTLNGVAKNDRRKTVDWALSLGVPLSPRWSVKTAYLNSRAQGPIGQDSDSLALAIAYGW